jgi:hypothetical protein
MSVTSPEPGKWEIVTRKGLKITVEGPYVADSEVKILSAVADMLADRIVEIEEIVKSRTLEIWSYPPFRDTIAYDTERSSEVNTLDWSTLKSYRYTARRDLQVFEMRVRAGVKARNTDSNPQTVEVSALVNNDVIVYLGSLTVDANTTLEDFVDVAAVVDIANASRDILVDLRAKSSSDNCYVSLTPPILVEIGYLFSPPQKYRRVGDKLMVIPESLLMEMGREDLERRVADRVIKKLEEEYELEIDIDPKSGKGSARVKRGAKK